MGSPPAICQFRITSTASLSNSIFPYKLPMTWRSTTRLRCKSPLPVDSSKKSLGEVAPEYTKIVRDVNPCAQAPSGKNELRYEGVVAASILICALEISNAIPPPLRRCEYSPQS